MKPAARAARKIATAHSDVMRGSLYVDVTIVEPERRARSISSRDLHRAGVDDPSLSGSRCTWLISQFWQ